MLSRRPRSWAKPGFGIWAGLALTPILIALAALLMASIGGGASATAGAPAKARVTPTKVNTAPPGSISYWTAARLKAATPSTLATVQGTTKAADNSDNGVTGRPGFAGGTLAGGLPASLPSQDPSAPGAAPRPYPGEHDSFEYAPKYRRFPIYRTMRINYTGADNLPHFCSGAATSGGTGTPQNVTWTAGHCLHNGNGTEAGWSTNVTVCPVYDNAANPPPGGPPNPKERTNTPSHCWEWNALSTTPEWYGSASRSRDYGVVYTNCANTDPGMPAAFRWTGCIDIGTRTGTDGFAWNQDRDKHWMGLGYPGGPGVGVHCSPQTGNKIWVTASEWTYSVNTDADGPDSNSVGSCNTPGADGSAWLLNFHGPPAGAAGGNVLINSNTSFWATGETGIQQQGPYFDTIVCFDWQYWTQATVTC